MKNYKVVNTIMIILAVIMLTVVFLFGYQGVDITTGDKTADLIITYCALFLSGCFVTIVFNNINKLNMTKKIGWLQGRLNLWNAISYRVKVAGEKAFNDMPLGIIVYNGKTKVEWANNFAKEIFMSQLEERDLVNISSELVEKMSKEDEFDIVLYERKIHVSVFKKDMFMFFTDKTDLLNLQNRYEERMQVAGIVNLDNLEDALGSMDAQEHNMIVSKLMGLLAEWCDEHNIYIRGFSERQYIILMDRAQLNNALKDNLKIIDDIKMYCYDKGLRITLSIGIACFDATINEVMDKATSQLELALNRGGNQAVVYVDGVTKFYGGKDASVESRTNVNVRVKAEDLVDLIEKADKVYIMTHGESDADALGSTIAVNKIARALGKESRIILEESQLDKTVKKVYKQLQENHMYIMEYFIKPHEAYSKMTDKSLLIITDCQGENLVSHPKALKFAKKIAIIDHHRRGNNAITNFEYYYNKTSASSTVELIVEMYQYLEQEIKSEPIEASLMLLGIVIDTASFIYRTTSQTFDVMSRLNSLGADMSEVKKFLRNDIEEFNKKNSVANNIEIFEKEFAISLCEENDIITRQFIAKVSDELVSVDGIRAAFCIGRLDENTVGISARSLGDINVQVLMEQLKGGGHFNNAATQLHDVNIEEAKNMLKSVLENFDKGGEDRMKVILIKEVKGKGKAGEIIDVASGFANHLIRSKQAVLMTEDNLKELERQKDQEKQKEAALLEEMKQLKVFLDENPITIQARVGKEGRLFGTISPKQIVDEYKTKFNITIDKRKFVSNDVIDALGTYKIEVNLHKEVKGIITVHIVEKKA